jgi:2,3-bisphosphoglycerate-independent phosphoglycerate mutase
MKTLNGISKQTLLVILDGFGQNPNDFKNAVLHANKPNINFIFANYPFTTIVSGGEEVGLPKGVAGNSEVGHLNLGAGRPVRQDLVRINEATQKNTFKDMPRYKEMIETAKKGNKRIHLLGLLSDGGVHSHINHLKHILSLLKNEPDIKVYLHAFMDGRDTGKDKGINYINDIMSVGGFTFASMQGRSIGMDRDRRWEKIEHAYKMLTGNGEKSNLNPADYIKSEYAKNIFDEFITPTLFDVNGSVQNGDAIFFFNFRPDRAKEISLALNDPNFKEFKVNTKLGYFLCMSPYIQDELPNLPILFDKEKIKGTLAEYLGKLNKKQFHIAETEKYAHVTYFFNGGEEKPFVGEERCLVPSPREIATYDLKPEMSAFIVKEKLLEKLDDQSIDFFVVNFANADMVGHTGNYEAAVKAIEALDICVKELKEKCEKNNILMLITADHGNADQMIYPDGSAHTSHSEADVPFCAVHPTLLNQKLESEKSALKDVAPTILYSLGIEKPNDFTGNSIFK